MHIGTKFVGLAMPLIETNHLLLKQLAAKLWIASFHNQSVDNLQQMCRQQAFASMRTHPDVGFL